MKGIIFNLLEDFIEEGWGPDVLEDIFSGCPLKTKEPFVAPGTYPDTDLFAIAGKTAEKLGIPLNDALRAFGKYAAPKLLERYPAFAQGHTDAKTFLMSVDGVIHVEVHKLMPKAVTPSFTYDDSGPDQLGIRYVSARKLCHLMEGMLDAVGEYFGQEVEHEQRSCLHAGDDYCDFSLKFGAVRSKVA